MSGSAARSLEGGWREKVGGGFDVGGEDVGGVSVLVVFGLDAFCLLDFEPILFLPSAFGWQFRVIDA